jgi:effector-binding domain-containing protein
VPTYLDAAFTEALAYARRQGAKDTGPCLALWHQPADILANEVAEAAIPIDRPLPSTDQVKVYELPPVQVAAVVHHGAFENFRQEHTALFAWIDANGYRIAGPYREIYINHNPGNMTDSATEIQYPVEKGMGE